MRSDSLNDQRITAKALICKVGTDTEPDTDSDGSATLIPESTPPIETIM
ncbi:hypothetical protein D3OALGA1CA_183 [Olavius algarvensis associated proteobacterium Delta 3]|nr:hypothetical protein D3OALGA1CA_183 [Olavius algarvensis associated proteobacterium Delta 3]